MPQRIIIASYFQDKKQNSIINFWQISFAWKADITKRLYGINKLNFVWRLRAARRMNICTTCLLLSKWFPQHNWQQAIIIDITVYCWTNHSLNSDIRILFSHTSHETNYFITIMPWPGKYSLTNTWFGDKLASEKAPQSAILAQIRFSH